MNIYIDESGSINNQLKHEPYFVIAMVLVHEKEKLRKAYKRFVSSNYNRLLALDADKIEQKTGRVVKKGGKMFSNNTFHELKGSYLDREMKLKFVEYFSKKHYFDVYYITLDNNRLTDQFCSNTARGFNYSIRMALGYFIHKGLLPDEDCHLQLDERNEKTEARYFLENYLNTELTLSGISSGKYTVSYFDSANNSFIQIADVFSNLYYSHLKTGCYSEAFEKLKHEGILKAVFEFPPKRG